MDDLDEAKNMRGDKNFDKSDLKLREFEAEGFERNAINDEEVFEAE